MSYSAIRGESKSKNYANGFVLQSDISNRHRVSPAVVDTVKLPNSIPFLRDPRTNTNSAYQRVATTGASFRTTFTGSALPRVTRKMQKNFHEKKMRESGWNQYEAPISFIN